MFESPSAPAMMTMVDRAVYAALLDGLGRIRRRIHDKFASGEDIVAVLAGVHVSCEAERRFVVERSWGG